MKELYISPEVELIGFVSVERLANDDFNYDDDWSGKDFIDDENAGSETGDIRIPIGGLKPLG